MRVIYADEKLRAVAGTGVITMYALEALIRPHLEPIHVLLPAGRPR